MSESDKKDVLGDECKKYEQEQAGLKADPDRPLLARLDGRSFHSYTSDLNRPYDVNMQACMIEACRTLLADLNPHVAYTQSDEITLAWRPRDFVGSEFPFGGKFQKLCSTLAAKASVAFYAHSLKVMPGKSHLLPTFDCRVWQVPSREDAHKVFVWRELDATKNSVSMLARSYFSHKELLNKSSRDMKLMLNEKGVNWYTQQTHFQRGVYLSRQIEEVQVTQEFLDSEFANVAEEWKPRLGNTVIRTKIKTVKALFDKPLVKMSVSEGLDHLQLLPLI